MFTLTASHHLEGQMHFFRYLVTKLVTKKRTSTFNYVGFIYLQYNNPQHVQ